MKAILTLLCLASAASVSTPTAAAKKPSRPNVLFLFSDDQQPDAVHALGNDFIRTPNIDRLVQRGFTFTRNFCMGSTSPAVCYPSRAMLMSGRTLYHAPLDLKGVTILPEAFRGAGYSTFGTGKWHNGRPAFVRGFGYGRNAFFGGMSNHDAVPISHLQSDGRLTKRRKSDEFSSEMFADATVRFLETYKGSDPFFAYVAFTAPHDPRTPPKEYRDLYDPEKLPLPANYLPQHPFDNGEMTIRDERLAPWPRTPRTVREHLADYYGMITHMDAQIGRILEALEKAGHADDTIVVFSSDHGLAVGRHGLLGKQNLYDHSVRAPLVFAGPGIPKGESDALVYLFDIYPTLCDLAHIAIPDSVEGKSLAPIIVGKERKVRDSVFLAYRDVQRAVRDERWKLIRYPRIDRTQLFDLTSDPNETRDLSDAPKQAPRVERMLALLRDWQTRLDDRAPLTVDDPQPAAFDADKANAARERTKRKRRR